MVRVSVLNDALVSADRETTGIAGKGDAWQKQQLTVEQHRQRRATRKATGPHPTFVQGRCQGSVRHAEAR